MTKSRRASEPGLPGRCPRCLLAFERCLCAVVPRVSIRTHVVVVRHAIERFKPSNSARLAALAVPSLRLVDHGLAHPAAPAAVEEAVCRAAALGAALLWPEGEPLATARPGRPVLRALVMVDGSWSQARRMRQRLTALRRLPCVSLPPESQRPGAPGESRLRLRRAPAAGRLSTLEALARALAILEGDDVAAPLLGLYDELCARCIPEPRLRAGSG